MVNAPKQTKVKKSVTVVRNYDAAADAKNRISLRGARTKHFHVMVLSNGSFVLEPRVLVAPDKIPPRTLKMIETSAASLKKGKASAPVDLSLFEDKKRGAYERLKRSAVPPPRSKPRGKG